MMELDPPISFPNKDDEIRYWMDVANQIYESKENIQRELEEYQENSMSLERELETSCEQTDKCNRELHHQNNKLKTEVEQLKDRLNRQSKAHNHFQREIQNLKICNDQLVKCIRELEQKNDDLERANREIKATEDEMVMRCNETLEKMALLETEMDEKEGLKITVQRLKDENKDLQQQIKADHRRFRNSVGSDIGISNNEQTLKEYKHTHDNNLCKYVRELEQKVENLESAHRSSETNAEELEVKLSQTVQSELSKQEANKIIIQQYIRDQSIKLDESSRDLSEEMEVQLRTHKSSERLAKSNTSKPQEDKSRNSSTSSRFSRNTDSRVKKVKDDEKRQNFLSFLKRLRHSQPNWLRKKD